MARRRSGKLVRSITLLALGGLLFGAAVVFAARPDDGPSWERRAGERRAQGDAEGELAALEHALEQLPKDGTDDARHHAELLALRGDCNLALNAPHKALADYLAAQQLEPGDPEAWIRVGRALIALGKFGEAALHLDEAALTFPAREQYFRFSAGSALYSVSRELLNQAEELLVPRVKKGLEEELEHALERYSSSAPQPPSREEIEEDLLIPPHATSERQKAFDLLMEARQEFIKADEKLADFDLSSDLNPAFGRVRLEMDLRAGRYYELKRTGEILLKLPFPAGTEDEELRLRWALANGMHELELDGEASQAFLGLRRAYTERANRAMAQGDKESDRKNRELARRAHLFAVEERLRGRRGKEALQLLEWLGVLPENQWFLQFADGFARYLSGDRTVCVSALERAAKLLADTRWNPPGGFRDTVQRRLVLGGLAEALLACGRRELAADVLTGALRYEPENADLLHHRIELLRPLRDRLDQVVQDEFDLLKIARDHGRNLARWEEDWTRLQNRTGQLQRRINDQSKRVLRVFAAGLPVDKGGATMMRAAVDARSKGRRNGPAAVMVPAGFALLKELQAEPCLVLQVYRGLLAAGQRDQAYLLLYGLAQEEPEIADFRLLLAQHDMVEGRIEEAQETLQALLVTAPGDADIANLAWDVARALGDTEAGRRVQESALGTAPEGPGRLIAARAALTDGYPEIVVSMARDTTTATPEGCTLLGLAASAERRLGHDERADELAKSVLAVAPGERYALATFLSLRAAKPVEGGTTECDAWLAEHADAIAALDADVLVFLAQSLFEAGGYTAAESVLRNALARSQSHTGAALLLADVLLALGRYDEADAQVEAVAGARAVAEQIKRQTLVRLFRDGTDAAWQFLRQRMTASSAPDQLVSWEALLGAATGRVASASALLHRKEVTLDSARERFLALTMLIHEAKVPVKDQVPGIAERTHLAGAGTELRDRELERWVSLDLASVGHRFMEALLRVLLLDDIASLAPMRRTEEAHLFERYPSLGFLARREAERADEAGQPARAAEVLLQQLAQDPGDFESLHLLALHANQCDAATIEGVTAKAEAAGLEPGYVQVFKGLARLARGEWAEGAELLEKAAEIPISKAAALLALVHAQQRRGMAPLAAPGTRAPWCDAAEKLRVLATEGASDRTLVAAAHDAGGEPVVLRTVARRLHDGADRMEPELRSALVATLLDQPGNWFEAYELAIADAAASGADVDRLGTLGQSLEAALTRLGDQPMPLSAVLGCARLAELDRAIGQPERANHWLDLAARSCPNHPDVLAARGRLALAAGDFATARRSFDRARVFGCDAPDVLAWLAEHALVTRSDPLLAKTLTTRALSRAAELPVPEQARVHELSAKIAFLLAATESAKDSWIKVARLRGEDPRFSVPIALESFARVSDKAAIARLEPIADRPGEAQPLARRLLEVARERVAAAARDAVPAPEPAPVPEPVPPPAPAKKSTGTP